MISAFHPLNFRLVVPNYGQIVLDSNSKISLFNVALLTWRRASENVECYPEICKKMFNVFKPANPYCLLCGSPVSHKSKLPMAYTGGKGVTL